MPAAQGVMKWPTNSPTLAALVDDLEMPLPDAAVDRLLLVHALEMAHDPGAFLRECWRVLSANGMIVLTTPLPGATKGHGDRRQPYDRRQHAQIVTEEEEEKPKTRKL